MASDRKHWRARIVDAAPLAFLTHAHEAGIAVALLIVAAPLLGGGMFGPESVHSQVPAFMAVTWAWCLVAGAWLTIRGLVAFRPRMEWAGQITLGWALAFYALALAWTLQPAALLAGAVFGVLGVVSWWRSFKITSQPYVQYRLLREARAAHRQAELERTIQVNREAERRNRESRRR